MVFVSCPAVHCRTDGVGAEAERKRKEEEAAAAAAAAAKAAALAEVGNSITGNSGMATDGSQSDASKQGKGAEDEEVTTLLKKLGVEIKLGDPGAKSADVAGVATDVADMAADLAGILVDRLKEGAVSGCKACSQSRTHVVFGGISRLGPCVQASHTSRWVVTRFAVLPWNGASALHTQRPCCRPFVPLSSSFCAHLVVLLCRSRRPFVPISSSFYSVLVAFHAAQVQRTRTRTPCNGKPPPRLGCRASTSGGWMPSKACSLRRPCKCSQLWSPM